MPETNYEYEYLVSENKRMKMSIENLENKLGMNPNKIDDIKTLVELASRMRILLMSCRNEQITMTLAKQIDYVLADASDLD